MKREDEVEVRTEEGRTEDDGGTRNPSDLETGLILQSTEHYEQARLFYTASEYIGYGPHSIQKGDLICVLPQIRVPIIPAKRAVTNYIVSTCFVLGLMDREAAEMLKRGQVALQRFHIR